MKNNRSHRSNRLASSSVPREWGQRLKAVLLQNELTHRRAARLAGVAPSVLDGWIKGATPSNLQAVKTLCDELEVDFAWLLTGQYSKPSNTKSLAELFEVLPYFEGLARIRIERLIPRNRQSIEDIEDAPEDASKGSNEDE